MVKLEVFDRMNREVHGRTAAVATTTTAATTSRRSTLISSSESAESYFPIPNFNLDLNFGFLLSNHYLFFILLLLLLLSCWCSNSVSKK